MFGINSFTSFFNPNDWIPNPIHILWGIIVTEIIHRVIIPKIQKYGSRKFRIYASIYGSALFAIPITIMGAYVMWSLLLHELGWGLLLRPISTELLIGYGLWLVCGIFFIYSLCRFVKINRSEEMPFVALFS